VFASWTRHRALRCLLWSVLVQEAQSDLTVMSRNRSHDDVCEFAGQFNYKLLKYCKVLLILYVLCVGTKLFLVWCLATILVIYIIDTFLFAKLRDQSYIDGKSLSNVT
jgi:hypothetical protein